MESTEVPFDRATLHVRIRFGVGWVSRAACVVVLTMMFAGPVAGQVRNVTRYTTANGLPGSRVRAALQDSRGFLWFGTASGLARYDGAEFRTYDRTTGLRGSAVVALAEAAGGQIIVATADGGVESLADGQARPLVGEGLGGQQVRALVVDDQGAIWAATDAGVVRSLGGQPQRVTTADAQPAGCCISIFADRVGQIWVGSQDGLYRVAGGNLRRVRGGENVGAVTALSEDHEGVLWVGTSRGVYRRLGDRLELVEAVGPGAVSRIVASPSGVWVGTDRGAVRVRGDKAEVIDAAGGLGDNRVNDVVVDREGNVWFATDHGVAKLVDTDFATFTTAQGLPEDHIVDVSRQGSTIWAATRIGVATVDDNARVRRQLSIDPRAGLAVTSVAPVGDRLLVGTTGGLLYRSEAGGDARLISRDSVTRLLSGQGGVWVGTRTGLRRLVDGQVGRLRQGDPLAAVDVTALAIDRAGRLWVGTREDGVWVWPENGTARQVGEDPWRSATIWSVAVGPDASVWVATNGYGAVRFLPDGGVTRLTRQGNGLISDFVHQIVAVADGTVWLYTNRGLDRWDAERGISHVDLGDGLATLAGSPDAAVAGAGGSVWFGTPAGLTAFRPGAVPRRPIAPPVVIRRFLAGGAEATAEDLAGLPRDRNDVEISFTALTYRDEAGTRFQYRLLGHSDIWSRPTGQRSVAFADLAPGTYGFEVQAINESGLWSERAARVEFVIRPMPWQTAWFMGAVGTLFLALTALYGRRRWRQVDDERKRLRRMVDTRTRELVEKNALLERMATTDELTGLPNRRFFLESMERELRKLTRLSTDQQLSLLVIDLDYFKRVNDRFGHAAGDEVLRQVARQLSQSVRATDLPARYGGEEFAILLPNTGPDGARFLAEKLRTDVEATRIRYDSTELAVTISVGVATTGAPERYERDIEEDLLRRADEAMYRAKTGGRNRVIVDEAFQDSSE